MARVSFNRNRVKLKALLGIRARLALLALILVGPLMLERVRSLEDTRAKQIAAASQEFSQLAQHSANAQREVIHLHRYEQTWRSRGRAGANASAVSGPTIAQCTAVNAVSITR